MINIITSLLKTSDKLVNLVGSIFATLIFALLIWASFKGFEITDESFYTVGYYFKIRVDNAISYFHEIYNLFFGFLNLNLFQNRILGIILSLTSSSYLAYQASLYFEVPNKKALWITILIFGFLSYAKYPMAVSYNTFSGFFIPIILATGITYLRLKKTYLMLVLGLLSGLLILNKFTNISFLLLLIVVFFIFKKGDIKTLTTSIGVYIVGTLIVLSIFFPSIEKLQKAYIDFRYGLSLSTSHGLSDMLIRIFTDLIAAFQFAVQLVPLLLALILIKKYTIKNQTLFIETSIVLTFLYVLLTNSLLLGFSHIFRFHLLLLICAIALIIFYGKFKESQRTLSFGLLLITCSFLGSFGTNNSLFLHYTFHGSVFGLGLFLILNTIPNQYIKNILILTTLTVSTIQITYNKIYSPYRLTKLNTQNIEVTDIDYLNKIEVNQETFDLIEELKELRNHPSEKVFLCSHQLGVSIVIDKEPLFFSWINKSSYHLISNFLEQKKSELNQNILFLIPSEAEDKKMIISELQTSEELSFDLNYRFMKTIKINKVLFSIYEHKQ